MIVIFVQLLSPGRAPYIMAILAITSLSFQWQCIHWDWGPCVMELTVALQQQGAWRVCAGCLLPFAALRIPAHLSLNELGSFMLIQQV